MAAMTWLSTDDGKKKAVHKTTTTDDKRLQRTLKRVGANTILCIEEVIIVKDDVVIQFQNSKVQASIASNTWVVTCQWNTTDKKAARSAGNTYQPTSKYSIENSVIKPTYMLTSEGATELMYMNLEQEEELRILQEAASIYAQWRHSQHV